MVDFSETRCSTEEKVCGEKKMKHRSARFRDEEADGTEINLCEAPTSTGNGSKAIKQQLIQRARQTTLFRPIEMEMRRRTKLKMKEGEVEGTLTFAVEKSKALHLSGDAAGVRRALFRRIEELAESRKDDDSSYFSAINRGEKMTVVLPLPAGYEAGGWRCHAVMDANECLHPNKANDEVCISCQSRKPKLKPEFDYLRLLSPSIRAESQEYLRIIRESDSELVKCEAAEKEATERLARVTELRINEGEEDLSSDDEAEDEVLMMNVELVQSGVWQRVSADAVLSMIAPRKKKAGQLFHAARADLAIMMQSTYELAVPHVQKVVRGFMLRASLDSIRQDHRKLAEFAAAVEIQRMIRQALASREANRLHVIKSNKMAIRIQCRVRQRSSYLERMHRWTIRVEYLRGKAAVKIQSLYRGHMCKLEVQRMAKEKKRLFEEMEKARQANQKNDAATVIQSHVRRCIIVRKCANWRVEMGLHERILMYIERFTVDGDFFSFVKSLNDDYIRLERTITSTIEREEKMAKTFVEKVVHARDQDHTVAWDKYHDLTRDKVALKSGQDVHKDDLGAKFVPPAAVIEKLTRDDHERRKPKANDGRAWERTRSFSVTSKLYGGKCRSSSSSRQPNNLKQHKISNTTKPMKPEEPASNSREDVVVEMLGKDIPSTLRDDNLDQQHQQHEKRLIKLDQVKARLRGQYLRFDIPNGLDDTTARFIMAVAMRYNFACPESTSLHGSFMLGTMKKKDQQAALTLAEPMIQHLNGKGLVFIRQLLPLSHMTDLLSSLNVSHEFIAIATSLMNVLHQVTGGNFLSRKYLMGQCRHFLCTQKELAGPSSTVGQRSEDGLIASRLGEFGASGEYNFDDEDIPGGLWTTKTNKSETSNDCTLRTMNDRPGACSRKHKTWAVAYTKKVLEQNDANYPAYDQYTNYDLLTPNN